MKKYVFDKRNIKKNLKKYGAIFGAMFVLFLVISFVMDATGASDSGRVVVLVVFGLIFVASVEWVLYVKRKNKKTQQSKPVKTIKGKVVDFNDNTKTKNSANEKTVNNNAKDKTNNKNTNNNETDINKADINKADKNKADANKADKK